MTSCVHRTQSRSIRSRFRNKYRRTPQLIPLILLLSACGLFEEKSDEQKDENNQVSLSGSINLKAGASAFKRVTLRTGQKIDANYKVSYTEPSQNLAPTSIVQELSVLDPDGKELSFDRPAESSVSIPIVAPVDGEYIIAVRNNNQEEITIQGEAVQGEAAPEAEEGFTSSEADASHANLTFKAALLFSKKCTTENSRYMTPVRNERESLTPYTKTITAPDGEYFLQPIVFYGIISDLDAGKVDPVTTAKIKLTTGGREIVLSELNTLEPESLGGSGSQNPAEVRAEYAGFINAAGAFYTTDTFRKRGNCDNAPTLPLSADPGKDSVELILEDESVSPPLSKRIPIRVTLGSPITTYSSGDTKQSSWDLCSYNPSSGEPYNSSQGSGACQSITISAPPSVRIDQLPSELYAGIATPASDPTRVLFYGRSLSREFINALIANKEQNDSEDTPSISFSGCLYNGGLVSLPATSEKVNMPVEEFNLSDGDIFSLGMRVGTYTAITDFFQGNVLADSSLTLSRNVPVPDGSLEWKKVNANWTGCTIRADSGVFAAAIADYGVYPGDEGMYGVVAP